MDKMEQMLVHFTFRYHFFEIHTLKSFELKFLNQIRIQIIGLPFFLHITGKYANKLSRFELS